MEKALYGTFLGVVNEKYLESYPGMQKPIKAMQILRPIISQPPLARVSTLSCYDTTLLLAFFRFSLSGDESDRNLV